MTNKIFMNKKTAEQVELISVSAEGRYIILTSEGIQKSYSESSFKKMFKAVETAENPKAETTEEPVKESTENTTEAEETAEDTAEDSKATQSTKELTAEEQENILNKIEKLFALAGNNPSESEAKAAMLKAQKLMAKYSISMDAKKGDKKYTYSMQACKHYHNLGYKAPLAQIIAKSFRCKPIIKGGVIHMFGRREDVKAAVECFNFCYAWTHKNGDALVVKARNEKGTGKGVFHSYISGVLVGITSSLEEGCTTLAIVMPQDVKDAFTKQFPDCKVKKSGMRNSSMLDYELYEKGVSDGKSLIGSRRIEVSL